MAPPPPHPPITAARHPFPATRPSTPPPTPRPPSPTHPPHPAPPISHTALPRPSCTLRTESLLLPQSSMLMLLLLPAHISGVPSSPRIRLFEMAGHRLHMQLHTSYTSDINSCGLKQQRWQHQASAAAAAAAATAPAAAPAAAAAAAANGAISIINICTHTIKAVQAEALNKRH